MPITDISSHIEKLKRVFIRLDMDYPSIGSKRRAELLRALMLGFFVFSVIGVFFVHGHVKEGLLISALIQACSYFLSRTRFLTLASLIGVVAVSIPQYYPSIVDPLLSFEIYSSYLIWMLVPLIVSSLWLQPVYFLIFFSTHLFVLMLTPSYFENVAREDMSHFFVITMIISVLLWISTKARNYELESLDAESKDLLEGRNMLTAVQDNIQESIVVYSSSGRLMSVNKTFREQFGYDDPDNILITQILRTEDNSLMEMSDLAANTNATQYTAIKKDGKSIPVEFKQASTLIHDELCSVGLIRDIQQQKDYEKSLTEEKEKAEHANQVKSDFISNMTHELRTPLNAIIGFSQLLENDLGPLNEQQRESIKEIQIGGAHLLELINEVLDMSKIEAGKLDIYIQAVALKELVEDCYSVIKLSAKAQEIKFNIDIADKCVVMADPLRLRQVLLNFMSNAVKYNRPDGRVSLFCEFVATDRIRINVKDSGYGLTEEQLGRLFNRFERLDATSGTIEGIGIGLAISKKFVELMGGSVGVESQKGEGSNFWLELEGQL